MSTSRLLARQIKAGRALLGWSREEMAAISGVSVPVIGKLEAADIGVSGLTGASIKLVSTLEASGVELFDHGGAGVRLRTVAGAVKSSGPATDVIAEMDAAIDDDRSGRNGRAAKEGKSARDATT